MSKFNYRTVVAIKGRLSTNQLLDEYDYASLIFLNTNTKEEREIFRTIGNVCQYILKSRGIDKPILSMTLLKQEQERAEHEFLNCECNC